MTAERNDPARLTADGDARSSALASRSAASSASSDARTQAPAGIGDRPSPVDFHSILSPVGAPAAEHAVPGYFRDLHLDQIVAAVTVGREHYDLAPFFHAPLHDPATIRYRQDIFRDLEREPLFRCVRGFAEGMQTMRERLDSARTLHEHYQKQRLFLDAVATYCATLNAFQSALAAAELRAQGWLALRRFLAEYLASAAFIALQRETRECEQALDGIHYCLLIKGDRITVRRYNAEADYGADIERTFARFRHGAGKDHLVEFSDVLPMNHIEGAVLERVAKLFPDVFGALDAYCTRNAEFLEPTIAAFDREVQFYLGYLEYMRTFRRAGLAFCYPEIAASAKDVRSIRGYDLALAARLVAEKVEVVRNDFHLNGPERIFVVSGPNQGGKTTFARTFGQMHHLASLGCPVPGTEARLFLFDRLFTHFEREEDLATLRGKLEDELVRVRTILDQATPNSIIILNEMLTSTTLHDAILLGRRIMERIVALDLLCVCVTFLVELASLGPSTVSLVSTVDPDNPARRTFRIVRAPADGLSHAVAIARKHGLTQPEILERIPS